MVEGKGTTALAGAAGAARGGKETKAQRAERLKAERNPWEMMPDIVRWAREGFDSAERLANQQYEPGAVSGAKSAGGGSDGYGAGAAGERWFNDSDIRGIANR